MESRTNTNTNTKTKPRTWNTDFCEQESLNFNMSNENLGMGVQIPYIIPFSAATKEAVKFQLERISRSRGKMDPENILLLHQMHSKYIPGHQFRGFVLTSESSTQIPSPSPTNENQTEISVEEIKSQYQSQSPPVWFIFNGMGSQWAGMGQSLMKFHICKKSLGKLALILKTKTPDRNFDLLQLLLDHPESSFENVLHISVSVAAVQIALIDLLSSLNIKPDGIIGHSIGELGAAYGDNCMTAEQVILMAHARGQAILELGPGDGAMAAIGLSWEEAIKKCPEGIYLACHNSKNNVTVSGSANLVQKFVGELKKRGIPAMKIHSGNQAFHSKYIKPISIKSKEVLDKIVPVPATRSSRWISSSIPESEWNSGLAKTCSAAYHVNNLISPVLFQKAVEKIPESAVVIEIGPHCLLQAVLKRSLPNCKHIGLLNKNHKDNTIFLCNSIGKMFNFGLNPDFSSLYENQKESAAPSIIINNFHNTFKSSFEDGVCETMVKNQPSLKVKNCNEIQTATLSNINLNVERESDSSADWLIAIARVLGMKTAELEQNSHRQLESLGMDSFMCAEIIQMIEMKCGLFLSEAQLHQFSFRQLLQILEKKDNPQKTNKEKIIISPKDEKIKTSPLKKNPTTPKNTKPRKSRLQNLYHTLKFSTAYLFSLCVMFLTLFIFLPSSLIFRLCVQIYLFLFHNRSKTILMTGFGEEVFAMLNFNTVHILKFSGAPDKGKIVKFLGEQLFNFGESRDSPFERLKWGIKKSSLFLCWVKDVDFDVERHLIVEETESSDWLEEMPRLAKYYHNLKWDEKYSNSEQNENQGSKPWWEIRIVYSKKLEEFLFVFAWNHAYGDGRSFSNLLQHGFADDAKAHQNNRHHHSAPKIQSDKIICTCNPLNGMKQLFKFGVSRLIKLAHMLHLSNLVASQNILNCLESGRRDFIFAELENSAESSIGKFQLSTLKSIKDPETGKPFNLNAVILYIISCVFQRIEKEQPSSDSNSKSNFLAAVTWSPHVSEFEKSQLTLENQSTMILTPVPAPMKSNKVTNKDGVGVAMLNNFIASQSKSQEIQQTQDNLTRAGRREFLECSKGFYQSLSLYPHPLSCRILRLLCRQDFLYSNILAPTPSNMTCFNGYQLKDVYAFIRPHPISVVAISNSFNDSVNISLTVPQRILKTISPEVHYLFFEYFQRELDELSCTI